MSWLGEKDLFYIENKLYNNGFSKQVLHLSTLRNYNNIAVQYNQGTNKITLSTTIANQVNFETIKKEMTIRLDVFRGVDPSLIVTMGQNIGIEKHGIEFDHG